MTKPPNRLYSRRQFFPMLIQELMIRRGVVQGGQEGSLDSLAELPDETLAGLTPCINPEFKILVQEGNICAQSKVTETVITLFPKDLQILAVFNQINGKKTLAQIAAAAAAQLGWEDDAETFGFVRDVFLSMAKHRVSLPKDPPESLLRGHDES